MNAGVVVAATCAMTLAAAPAAAQGTQATQQPKPVVVDQPTAATKTSQGILNIEVTPDTVTTIRVAQGVITRVALPDEAKSAICGDLFDATSNTGSFLIEKSGKDVFIKAVQSKGQSNLFIKTDDNVYAFDLLVVPPAQAYRVVNVNQPSYREKIEADRQKMLADVESERRQMQSALNQQFEARRQELEQQSADEIEAERRKLRAEADRRASELSSRRLADGIMTGLNGLALVERRGKFDQVTVELGTVAYTFEGKLYVPYKVVNAGTSDLSYREPRVVVRGAAEADGEKFLPTTTFTSRGEYRVDAGETAQGVVVFERPTLEQGERLIFVLRATGGSSRVVQLRLQ